MKSIQDRVLALHVITDGLNAIEQAFDIFLTALEDIANDKHMGEDTARTIAKEAINKYIKEQ